MYRMGTLFVTCRPCDEDKSSTQEVFVPNSTLVQSGFRVVLPVVASVPTGGN